MYAVLVSTLCWFCASGMAFGQCPTVAVVGPPGLTWPGEKIVFRAEVGVAGAKLDYSWTIDKGTIIDGQDTSSITVVADRDLEGQIVTATVQIDGLPYSCKKTASETANIGQRHGWHWEDSWERLKPNDMQVRLDSFFAGLANNPTHIGLIQLQITHEERFDSENARIQFILKHAKFRKLDKRRLRFALELAEKPRTSWVRFVSERQLERELPCNQCLIIRGEELSVPRP